MVEAVRETMTYDDARKKLRWYYEQLSFLKKFGIEWRPGDRIIYVPDGEHSDPVAAQAIRELSREMNVIPVMEAIEQLPSPYQTFIELRYGRGWSFKAIARVVCGCGSRSSAQRFEVKVLSAFIAAFGRIPTEE
ncbi:MAG: hypothetical protein M1548_08525 [Actinobacteria bacterium]|nr:hypothetical protein [Actinomycetota bacterium]